MNDALLLLGTFYDNICSTFYTLNEIIAIYIKVVFTLWCWFIKPVWRTFALMNMHLAAHFAVSKQNYELLDAVPINICTLNICTSDKTEIYSQFVESSRSRRHLCRHKIFFQFEFLTVTHALLSPRVMRSSQEEAALRIALCMSVYPSVSPVVATQEKML